MWYKKEEEEDDSDDDIKYKGCKEWKVYKKIVSVYDTIENIFWHFVMMRWYVGKVDKVEDVR